MEIDRENLLKNLKNQGFSDEIVKAFSKVKRENFVPSQFTNYAYEDIAIPLEDGSTLSQPTTIAVILSILDAKQHNNILEIGSGSGYVLSLTSEIIKSGKIYGMEINPRLAIASRKLLELDSNIEIINRSGLKGLPEKAQFDRILVSAAFPDRVIPYKLLEQLKDPGILVAPVKQTLLKLIKNKGQIIEEEFPGFVFVPFVVEEK